ncbi:MAG TPA: choline dehydrogenase [Rhodobacteraceae bacterium]|nr:choline dehydrogenase [Paracoccaceae bacterium]
MSKVFDFIIVGAGSAGCVLANKLSMNPKTKVLLLEAGGSDNKFWIKTPLGYAKTFSDPSVNWCYSTAPDIGLNGRTAYWPRGRVIGGSSSINAMAYLRGLPHDFDDWETAGAKGWGWETVRETYEALETQVELNPDGTKKFQGNGPLIVSDLSKNMHPFSQHFLRAATEMGWPLAGNLNGKDTEGLMTLRSTVKNGRRWSSADAYLRPALKRPNLCVIKAAKVQNITINGTRATGLTYQKGGEIHTVEAIAEVILSAGAINSPQLLQLSGIGPGGLLKNHGIPVRHDMPQVGEGLQDHLAVNHYFHATEPTLNNCLGHPVKKIFAGMQYILTREGPLSVPVNQISGFVRSTPDATVPNVQIYANPISYSTQADGSTVVEPNAGFLLCAQPCRPSSRGTVHIAANDPNVAPTIQPNSLSTQKDCDMVVTAGKLLAKLAQTPAIQRVTKTRLNPDITTLSNAGILENFRNRASTVFHPTSTCRMGSDKTTSVTDSHCRVHGLQALRVIDASSFPNLTSGNTNAPVVMLASRAASLILKPS